MIIKTTLPIFTGFYGTLFGDISDNKMEQDIEYYLDEFNVDLDCDDFDFKSINLEVSKEACNGVQTMIKEYLDIDSKIKFVALDSPRYYNFENDEIICEIDMDIKEIINYIEKNIIMFDSYISENFTSRDGFASFVSNSGADWVNDLKQAEDLPRKLGTVLQFALDNEADCLEMDLYCHCNEQVQEIPFNESGVKKTENISF
tara:strand:+ start:88 stop:693 length:606 start_codon:yes stop_codon:yes gene_type:complete